MADMFRLDGKVAVVIGGAGGIGQPIAFGLAEQGAKVVVASRNLSSLEEVARKIQLEAYVGKDEVRFKIRDEGPGFDVAASTPSSDADAITQCSGRGLALIHTFMDRVEFNDAGNEIVMVKSS